MNTFYTNELLAQHQKGEREKIKRTRYQLSHLSDFLCSSGQNVSYDEPLLHTGSIPHLYQDDVGEQHQKSQVRHLKWNQRGGKRLERDCTVMSSLIYAFALAACNAISYTVESIFTCVCFTLQFIATVLISQMFFSR